MFRACPNEGLIHFDRTGHLVDAAMVLSVADATQHEPCRSLSDAERATDFIGADTVFAVGQHPHRAEPLVQTDWRIFADGPDLDGELLAASQASPDLTRGHERDLFATTLRALWLTVWPLRPGNRFEANRGVRKVLDGFHQTAIFVQHNREGKPNNILGRLCESSDLLP